MRKLTGPEIDVLRNVTNDDWVRPMDIGGRDGSDHSAILNRLVKMGLVEKRRRNTLANWLESNRGSYMYKRIVTKDTMPELAPRVTRSERMLQFTRILASYGCAGVDQEPDDPKMCGKCGPCEASAFLREIGKSLEVKGDV